jgi:hypothetical protein
MTGELTIGVSTLSPVRAGRPAPVQARGKLLREVASPLGGNEDHRAATIGHQATLQ